MKLLNNFTKHLPYDIKVFLILIPIISAFNYYLTWSNPGFNWFTLITFLIDTIEGYLAFWGMRTVIIRLDKKLPYAAGIGKRILWQILLTLLVGLGIIIILTEAVSWAVRGRSAVISFYTLDVFIFIIWILGINA